MTEVGQNGAEFHFPPPSYSERREQEMVEEDEETRKIVDSGQHERSHTVPYITASSGGAGSKWS